MQEAGGSSHLVVVVDNRLIPQSDFQRDCAATSLYQNLLELVGKLLMVTSRSWASSSIHLITAASSASTSMQSVDATHLPELNEILRPRFSVNAGTLLIRNTWMQYLTSAIHNISSIAKDPSTFSSEKFVVVIYGPDVTFFGDATLASFEEGLRLFLQECSELQGLFKIRIVAIKLQDSDTTARGSSKLLREVMNAQLPISVDTINVSTLQFDYELRVLLGLLMPCYLCTLSLGPGDELACMIHLRLFPHTMAAADCLPHMSSIELCGVCSRAQINPLFIAGYGIEVTCPSIREGLPSHRWTYNQTLILSLRSWLASRDMVMILKAPYAPTGTVKLCSKFWALVPPAFNSSDGDNMTLLLLFDRDQLIIPAKEKESSTPPTLEMRQLFDQMQDYLTSMLPSPHANSPYNPWKYIGGSFDFEFNNLHRVQASIPSIPPVTPTPVPSVAISSISTKHTVINSKQTACYGKGRIELLPPPQAQVLASSAVSGRESKGTMRGGGSGQGRGASGRGRGRQPNYKAHAVTEAESEGEQDIQSERPRFLKRKLSKLSKTNKMELGKNFDV